MHNIQSPGTGIIKWNAVTIDVLITSVLSLLFEMSFWLYFAIVKYTADKCMEPNHSLK